MVLQPTGVWKYHKKQLIIDNVLSLVLSSRQAKQKKYQWIKTTKISISIISIVFIH